MQVEEQNHVATQEASPHPEAVHTTPSVKPRTSIRTLLIVAVLAVIALGCLIGSGLVSRTHAEAALTRETLDNSITAVSTVRPQVTNGAEEVVLPGNMQAFLDTPIWARASGYLKAWYVDIGSHVHKGQLLADIEALEVDQQLQQAREQLATNEANLKLSQITAERYSDLFKTDSVSKQDVDNAVQDAAAKTATVKSAQANVSRLEQVVAYEKVYAPFDGVITQRNIDVGALVNADTNTAGKELFHLASNNMLRVYISVPEIYSRAARPGVSASLTLNEFPGRQFRGTIARNANAIDQNSRTLLVEVDVANPTGELLPGSYVSVHLKLPSKVNAVTVPSNALMFRSEGLRVAVLRNSRADLRTVILGRDFGDSVELVSGITPQDTVIVNPPDSLISGEQVRAANAAAK